MSRSGAGENEDRESAEAAARLVHFWLSTVDGQRSLVFDLVLSSLIEVARRALQGRVEGRAALVIRLLGLRFGPLTDEVQNRIAAASIDELDVIGERLLTASTLPEALGSR